MRILNFNTKSISQQDEVSILVIELIERLVPSTTGSSGLRGSFSFSQSRRRGFGSHDQKFRNNHLGEKVSGQSQFLTLLQKPQQDLWNQQIFSKQNLELLMAKLNKRFQQILLEF